MLASYLAVYSEAVSVLNVCPFQLSVCMQCWQNIGVAMHSRREFSIIRVRYGLSSCCLLTQLASTGDVHNLSRTYKYTHHSEL